VSQEMYRLIQDLTEKAKQEIQTFYDFPESVRILEAKEMLGPDGWGGQAYYLTIKYEIDGIQYKMMRPVYANLGSAIIDILFDIVDSYRRTHVIQ